MCGEHVCCEKIRTFVDDARKEYGNEASRSFVYVKEEIFECEK